MRVRTIEHMRRARYICIKRIIPLLFYLLTLWFVRTEKSTMCVFIGQRTRLLTPCAFLNNMYACRGSQWMHCSHGCTIKSLTLHYFSLIHIHVCAHTVLDKRCFTFTLSLRSQMTQCRLQQFTIYVLP